jgi:hypothetical protein
MRIMKTATAHLNGIDMYYENPPLEVRYCYSLVTALRFLPD